MIKKNEKKDDEDDEYDDDLTMNNKCEITVINTVN